MSDEESSIVSFKTAARMAGAPSNIKVVVYGNDAHINWQPPVHPNGYIEQYEIVIQPSDSAGDSATFGVEQVNKDRRSREAYLMNMFQPFTYYDLKLSARNRVGGGDQWEIQKFTVSAPDSKLFYHHVQMSLSLYLRQCKKRLMLTMRSLTYSKEKDK